MKTRNALHPLGLTFLALTVGGCLSPPRLSDGQMSGLTFYSSEVRNQLVPTPSPGILPPYHPASCTYDERHRSSLGVADHNTLTLSVASVASAVGDGDKLFVHMGSATGESTVLLDKTGKLLDINVLSLNSAQRLTPEDFDSRADEEVRKHHSILTTDTHYLNTTTATLPHFIAAPSRPGVRVADVMVEKDQVWGTYVYRGVVSYHGVRAELFDLIHVQRYPVVRGFLLLDTRHMLPLLFNLTMGFSSYELEQIECSRG
jgi:hypothetical protein